MKIAFVYKVRMRELPTPTDMEIMAVHAGITMREACRRAKVSDNIFRNWKRGKHSPRMSSVERLIAVLNAAIQEREK